MRIGKWLKPVAAVVAAAIVAGASPNVAYAGRHHAHHASETTVYADCYQDGVCTGDGCCDEYGVCQNGGSCAWSANQGVCTGAGYYSGRGHRSGHHH